jgi:hypothetical protein
MLYACMKQETDITFYLENSERQKWSQGKILWGYVMDSSEGLEANVSCNGYEPSGCVIADNMRIN